jgi:hypothetical protein
MDMRVGRQHVTFVWTLADPNTAAQVYLKRDGTGLRTAEKYDDEDVALSAHMVIYFAMPQNVMRYRVALEDHEGISRSRIQPLFQTLLQQCLPSVIGVTEEGTPKTGAPRVLLDAHEGRLMRDTENKPAAIEVIKLTPRRTMVADAADAYHQTSDRRYFKLVREGAPAELRDLMVAKARELRGEFPDYNIRIRWESPDDPNHRTEVTRIDPLQDPRTLLERATTRDILIDGFHNLPQATDKIVQRLADRMLDELRATVTEDEAIARRRRRS